MCGADDLAAHQGGKEVRFVGGVGDHAPAGADTLGPSGRVGELAVGGDLVAVRIVAADSGVRVVSGALQVERLGDAAADQCREVGAADTFGDQTCDVVADTRVAVRGSRLEQQRQGGCELIQ